MVPLALHFLARHGASEEKPGVELSDEAQRLLLAHSWPGNVRELENQMQRALALIEPGELLTREHLSERMGAFLEPIETRIQAPQRSPPHGTRTQPPCVRGSATRLP
ncbi:MAG: hypothetical protein VX546_14775 [Myxococcota bacterium]|nr:hypothetical protein [Myxococcota bacterium]